MRRSYCWQFMFVLTFTLFGQVKNLKAEFGKIFPEGSEYILPPFNNDNNTPDKLLVIIPGGLVPNHHYRSLALEIQKKVKSKLWVAVITCKWTGKLCNPIDQGPLGPKKMVNKLIKKVEKKIGNSLKNEDLFIAGHSLGGQSAYLLAEEIDNIGGVLLWASYTYSQLSEYQFPVLTLGAELNAGQSKVARIAQYFEDYEQLLSQNGASATLQKPVIILPGLNHSDFSQGFKVKGDLDSEVDAETAIDRISEASAAFINVNDKYSADELGNSQNILAEMIEKTRIMTAPVLEAKELEETGHWCVEAQKLVAGEFAEHLDFNTINVNSNYSFMRAHANVKQDDSGRLNVTVVSYPRKQKDTLKLGKTISAEDIACKMTSKEKLALLFGVSLKEKIVSCTDINKYAFSLAENKLPESVLDRYHRLGKKVVFEEDFKPYIGPQFVFATKLNFLDTENFLHLSSPILYTSLTSKTYPGKHYCKLISPARAMEWIMTDSLTK